MAAGKLVIVATPIGNLGDLSPRAVSELEAADLVAAEDTRRTRKLLSAAEIHTKLISYHRDNERQRTDWLVEKMQAGKVIALVSDAGMPTIADPGELLVRRCLCSGVAVTVVPGPSSVVAALAVGGLPAGRFVFESYLPRKGRARRDRLSALAGETRTIVLFEAPTRVAATLGDLADALGPDRKCAVCRELTKLHEEVYRGTLADAAEHFDEARGEIVLVVEGADETGGEDAAADVRPLVASLLESGLSVRDAAQVVATERGIRKRDAYRVALEIRGESDDAGNGE